jgi:hypothetical protein
VASSIRLASAIGLAIDKPSARTYCFVAGTPIATEHGQRPIESISAGQRAWSCDLASGQWRLCRVEETYAFDHVGERVETFVGGSRIASTYHHPYWVVEGDDLDQRSTPDHVAGALVPNATVPGRWVDAGDLRVGDVLLLMDGRRLPVEEILVRRTREPVYNFAVEGLHNYAVGPDRVLVHNSCGDAADVRINGNSHASTRPATLYYLQETETDKFLKWGITQDTAKRYSKKYLRDKDLIPVNVGPRADIAAWERFLVRTQGGPLNHESWSSYYLP